MSTPRGMSNPEGSTEASLVHDSGQSREQPGVHAFIVGVSDYPHLPRPDSPGEDATLRLKGLTSAARSACSVAEWLLANGARLPQPLASLRLLLSPSRDERAQITSACELAARPVLDQFLASAAAWRRDLLPCPDSVAFFYFAGHGMQGAAADQVLMLDDFGENPEAGSVLRKSITTSSLVNGMAPTQEHPDIARRQWFFFDCCRDTQKAIRKAESAQSSDAFAWDVTLKDDRDVSVFNAAIEGARARAHPEGVTVFSEALLDCLSGAAGERRGDRTGWHVSTGSLGRALSVIGKQLERLDPRVRFDPQPRGDLLSSVVLLDGAPSVKVTLNITPAAAVGHTSLLIRNGAEDSVEVAMPLQPNPYPDKWPAGSYRIDTEDTTSSVQIRGEFEEVMPPHWSWVGP
jgi:hypothetical protein